MAERRAEADWEGNLLEGSGRLELTSSESATLPVTWASRVESPDGRTSPEELVAGAHASCYAMAFAHALAQAGTEPERLETSAAVTFVPGSGITRVALTVRGTVPGLDEASFREAAETAKVNCPVSMALAGVPDISVDARLGS